MRLRVFLLKVTVTLPRVVVFVQTVGKHCLSLVSILGLGTGISLVVIALLSLTARFLIFLFLSLHIRVI